MVKQNEQLLDKITEVVRDVQTEILKAFFPFQESVSIRFRKLETDNSNLNLQPLAKDGDPRTTAAGDREETADGASCFLASYLY